ncbi:hypothetical protein DM02DRAFT_270025 [Periconia macrospinosa]|uniref:Uncharacterized protein n=1 Tax=Periconia macrospinosa TaxID=97972 RepID=A0A2V1D5S6_9PLEO|nr:hypothetical protein DM02DRAFT_270025 [Periconia macrospinosa]
MFGQNIVICCCTHPSFSIVAPKFTDKTRSRLPLCFAAVLNVENKAQQQLPGVTPQLLVVLTRRDACAMDPWKIPGSLYLRSRFGPDGTFREPKPGSDLRLHSLHLACSHMRFHFSLWDRHASDTAISAQSASGRARPVRNKSLPRDDPGRAKCQKGETL